MLAAWLNHADILWCHVPNAGAHRVQYRAKQVALGVKAGVPDVLIFTPPPNRPSVRGVAIEMKRKLRSHVSDVQKYWLEQLGRVNYMTRVARGADDAILWLTDVLGYHSRMMPLRERS